MAAGNRSTLGKQDREAARASSEKEPPAFGVTSYHVARRAGVSQSAVSRCFRPGASVAPATRLKIIAAATELGYQPNALAQGLISGRTNVVAVLISRLTNLYYPEVLAELNERLAMRGIRTLLFAVPQESDVGKILPELWRHRVDGAIAAVHLDGEQLRAFHNRGVALVLYNRLPDELATSVACDAEAGEYLLVDRLVQAGHQRFGIIGGPEDSEAGERRVRAASQRLAMAGFSNVPLARGAFSYESGGEAIGALLDADSSLDAVICANDIMALGAIDAARAKYERRVPETLSVVGFDGVDPATWSSYQLTSIRQPVQRMTEAAVSMLVERIEDPGLAPERRLFAGSFVAGGSARLRNPGTSKPPSQARFSSRN